MVANYDAADIAAHESHVRIAIADECNAVKDLLLAKNREYGNSAFEPIGVFSSLPAAEQLRVRIDDKLSRIMNIRKLDSVKIHEDTEMDLIGYLILLRVSRRLDVIDNQHYCDQCDQPFDCCLGAYPPAAHEAVRKCRYC